MYSQLFLYTGLKPHNKKEDQGKEDEHMDDPSNQQPV
jgi:hypothetical protein